MALVAYENSDSSDYEDDVTNAIKTEATTSEQIHIVPGGSEQSGNLFNLLPKPNIKKTAIEEDDEFLHKKETSNILKPKAKITVPSLSDFKDVGPTVATKPKSTNSKNSGLLSMLPQPRHGALTTKTMVPNVLTRKPIKSVKKKTLPPPSAEKNSVAKKNLAPNSSDESEDEDLQNDFFSINKPVEIIPIENVPLDNLSHDSPIPIKSKTTNIQSYFKQDVQDDETSNVEHNHVVDNEVRGHSNGYMEPEPSSSGNIALDDEAIRQLCGSRGKRKREEIQIVDVDQREVLGNSRELLLKGLMDDTTKRVSASKRKGNEPTSQQKRKHQITYLAHQAKANEAELQNQWANSRMSKRQTQSKYGF